MAIIKQGILGGFSGKVGSVCGTSWKGIGVMKSLPLSVANPKTTGQVTQRNAMSSVVLLAKLLLGSLIKILWDRFAVKMSGFNAFVQANIKCFVGTVFTTPESFIISQGKMSATNIFAATGVVGGTTITVVWNTSNTDNFQTASDRTYIVILDQSANVIASSFDESNRGEGTMLLVTSTLIAGTGYYAYLAFKRLDGSIVSNTSYLPVTLS